MGMKSKLFMLAGMMMMGTQGEQYFDAMKRTPSFPPQPRYDLPSWKVGDSIICAKDEKTAIKYAKKRGLWKEGITIKRMDEK